MPTVEDLPSYRELILPTLRAVEALGGSAQAREITAQVLEAEGHGEDLVELTYENRDKSVLIDRLDWARSYAKLGGALESPRRGLFILTSTGKDLLQRPGDEAQALVDEMDRSVREERRKRTRDADSLPAPGEDHDPEDSASSEWRDELLERLHRLSPEAFEEFVMYLLRTYGLEITRVGGSGDQGIDGIGLAPMNDVLSTSAAVQAKRYERTKSISRDQVALFQRDAAAAGAERAIFVTLSRFTEAARRAATVSTPTVDLIDGDKLCDLVRKQEIGIAIVPRVDDSWFDRFED